VQELADLGVAGIKDSSFDIMVLANFVRGDQAARVRRRARHGSDVPVRGDDGC